MTSWKDTNTLITWIMLAVIVGVLAGLVYGRHLGSTQQEQAALERTTREDRILAWIVETNPTAAIKDFLSFPKFLVEMSAARGIDYRLVLAICLKESQMNPRAVGAAGEIGLMQILPDTAMLVVKRLNEQHRYVPPKRVGSGYADLGSLGDPKWNVLIGVNYLAWQMERFGGMNLTALRAYNRNPDRARDRRPGDTYAEDVARNFLVLAHLVRD